MRTVLTRGCGSKHVARPLASDHQEVSKWLGHWEQGLGGARCKLLGSEKIDLFNITTNISVHCNEFMENNDDNSTYLFIFYYFLYIILIKT